MGSNVALRAYRLLRTLAEQPGLVDPDALERISTVMTRLRNSLLQTEHYHLKIVAPYFVRESLRAGWQFGSVTHSASKKTVRRTCHSSLSLSRRRICDAVGIASAAIDPRAICTKSCMSIVTAIRPRT
jgi:hypothetical protein